MRILSFIRFSSTYPLSLLATLVTLGASSSALAESQSQMTVLGRTSQPIGHYNFCLQNPHECQENMVNPLAPKLTRKMWNQMVEANHYANSSVEPVTDLEQYEREEHWTMPGKYGDCEDYVLLKRQLLIDHGWPVSSLLVTVVKQPNGEGHAVLTVRTDNSDYILDNLNGKILPWNKTRYHYLKRQSTLHSGRWTDIRDARNIVGAIK